MQINSKIPPSIAERRGELDITARENLPKLWEQAIAACLSKDPNLRPSSAGTLAEMLGLKPSTATSQSLNFGSTQRIKNPAQSETPKKEPTPCAGSRPQPLRLFSQEGLPTTSARNPRLQKCLARQ